MSGKLEVTLVRGLAGHPEAQRRVIWSLGLKKREQTVVVNATRATLGKLEKVRHMLSVREV